jgi:hypothetical protein
LERFVAKVFVAPSDNEHRRIITMYIYPKHTGIRPDTASQTQDVSATDRSSTVKPTPVVQSAVDRSDKVQISDAGRALAARDGDATSGLSPARAASIRGRVLSGAYDTLEVVDSVARRLLDSGDL